MTKKLCPKCKQQKDISEFNARRQSKDGHAVYCKECSHEYTSQWKNKDREHYRELRRARRGKWGLTPRGRYTVLRSNSKLTGRQITITSEEFVDWYTQQHNKCHYCGVELTNNGMTKINVDRKDNNEGYTVENMALTCKRCNLAKGSWFTEQEMLEIAAKYLTPRLPAMRIDGWKPIQSISVGRRNKEKTDVC